jgi:hypothetical protein
MIIGYYPGAGGNRYYQYLLGREYSVPKIAYDGLTTGIEIRGKYCNNDIPNLVSDNGNMLLHCVNSKRIREVIKNNTPLIIIKADLKKSLCREWSIKGKYKPMFQNSNDSYENFMMELYQTIRDPTWPVISTITEFNALPKAISDECIEVFKKNRSLLDANGNCNFINAAYTAIIWHTELYKKWPLEISLADQVVDIDNDQTEFASLMRNELNLYNNALFEFAWDIYNNYGPNAPINDLYKQNFL